MANSVKNVGGCPTMFLTPRAHALYPQCRLLLRPILCGIGLLYEHGAHSAEPVIAALGRMAAAQRQRGPDGEGWLLVDDALHASVRWHRPALDEVPRRLRLAAAFRRLIVQEPGEAGRQPLAAPGARSWILHNGEIFDHGALRRELEARGHAIPGRSDAAVALAAYREWGTACFERFRGMWSILIIDLDRARLVGCRDRLGIKPLFWSVVGGRLALASEPAALRAAIGGAAAPDDVRLREFLEGTPPRDAGRSFFRDIRPVPAGSWFEIDLRAPVSGPPAFHRYWRLSSFFAANGEAPAFERARDEFAVLVDSAVREQLAAAVPVGTLLSGGLDTSVLVSLAARHANGAGAPAYAIVYADPSMSEWPYVLAAARHAGVRAHTYTLSPAEAWQSVDAVVRAQGQPLLGQDLVAQYHAYRLAREHGSIVVLDGQGADELLGGLPLYAGARYRELLRALRLRELATELAAIARRHGVSRASVARGHFVAPIGHALRRRARIRRYAWLPPAPNGAPAGNRARDRSRDPSLLNRTLFELVVSTNLPAVLLHLDRSSMAHGVESRVPFLDHRIVEFCFRMPPEYKVQSGIRKRLLWESARELIPSVVLERRDKRRFVSRDDWLPLRPRAAELRDMATNRALVERAGLRGPALVRFVDDFLRGRHDDHFAVWRLYTLSRWLELA